MFIGLHNLLMDVTCMLHLQLLYHPVSCKITCTLWPIIQYLWMRRHIRWLFVYSLGHPWCYDDHCGMYKHTSQIWRLDNFKVTMQWFGLKLSAFKPSKWHSIPHAYCGGERQSPVNLVTSSAVVDKMLDKFTYTKFDDKHAIKYIINTGHTGLFFHVMVCFWLKGLHFIKLRLMCMHINQPIIDFSLLSQNKLKLTVVYEGYDKSCNDSLVTK